MVYTSSPQLARTEDPEKAIEPVASADDARQNDPADPPSPRGSSHHAAPATKQDSSWYEKVRIRKGKPPVFLKVRSAEWLIQLCVGFGVFVDLCSKRAVAILPYSVGNPCIK